MPTESDVHNGSFWTVGSLVTRLPSLRARLRNVAGAVFNRVDDAGIIRVRVPAIRQVGADDFADGRDSVGDVRVGRARREVDVRVRVDAPAEVEVGPGEETQVVLREEAELEDRNGDRLERTPHTDFGAPSGVIPAAVKLAVTAMS